MSVELPNKECDIYGCRRPKADPVAIVEMAIGEEVIEVETCTEHKEFIETAPADLYELGFTFRHEVEIRPLPAIPAPLPEEPEV